MTFVLVGPEKEASLPGLLIAADDSPDLVRVPNLRNADRTITMLGAVRIAAGEWRLRGTLTHSGRLG